MVVPPVIFSPPPHFPFTFPSDWSHNITYGYKRNAGRWISLFVSPAPLFSGALSWQWLSRNPPPPASAKACCFPETGVVLPKVVRLSLLGGHESCL